jgi:hypothetical protein
MGKYENDEVVDMIIENYDNINQTKKIISLNDYYDKNINLLDSELKNLKIPVDNIKEDLKDINFFKYETFSKEKTLLQKKRNPDNKNIETSNESSKTKKAEVAEEKINEEMGNDININNKGKKKLLKIKIKKKIKMYQQN